MARARNIKPGIMENEALAECDHPTRLLFVYLWMLADREGRLEDRPRRIGAKAMPYDGGMDFDAMLADLAWHGFILRYEHEGTRYIQVLNFDKHQSPHVKEAGSKIPAPDGLGDATEQAPDKHQTSTDQSEYGYESGTKPAPPRLSDSHDSLIGDNTSSDEEESPAEPATPAADACPAQDIVTIYHEQLPELPRVARLTEKRRKWLKARWREEPEHQQLDFWRKFFAYIRGSDFLMGNNPRGWCADFEWIVNVTNFYKIIEGRYDNDAQRS